MINVFKNIVPKSVDVILSSVPWTDTTIPLMAVPILKSIVLETGRTCVGLDLNANILEWTRPHIYKNKLIDFFIMKLITPKSKKIYLKFTKLLQKYYLRIILKSLG